MRRQCFLMTTACKTTIQSVAGRCTKTRHQQHNSVAAAAKFNFDGETLNIIYFGTANFVQKCLSYPEQWSKIKNKDKEYLLSYTSFGDVLGQ